MAFDRREFLAASVAATFASLPARMARAQGSGASNEGKLGIPGPYPGRVVAVHHPNSIVSGVYQGDPVEQMIDRGMRELTGTEIPLDAWRKFFQPGDVVGIKLNPVGMPHVISAPEVLHPIIQALEEVGIPRRDIVAYDRYGEQFQRAGFVEWLPAGVRWTSGSPTVPRIQLDMDGYDPDVYMEMPLVHPAYAPEYDLSDAHARRSYVAKFLTKEVNKVINLCVVKHHQSAGVTLALKNMSHGLVNNVSRSHATTTANACGIFIPAVVDLPVIRERVVLHILDGVKAAYHGGPGSSVGRYTWEHKTMYFATDPVALDKTGWQAIDKKRAEVGRAPIALLKPDEDSRWLNAQVEHIELASNFGLGVFDDDKIDLKRINLG
ncbi:MAG: DUF362 domain-containing protein [Acidobacteriia bacterium]|nr:DUF362 domain-containing protein [Terriglobia bacterium]